MRCLVLGGNGFIGRHLVDALLAQDHFVRVFGRSKLSESDIRQNRNLQYVEGDFSNEVDLGNAVRDIDICFHLVSTTLPKSSNENPIFDVETNLLGTIHLLQHAVKNSVRKIIFISSGGTVYGIPEYLPLDEKHPTNPICSYGIVKLSIEKYLELYRGLYGLDCMILRLSNPYGHRQRLLATQGAIAVFLGKILKKQDVEIWGDGTVVRDYIHISDVVAALLSSMHYEGREYVMNIGSGIGVDINQLICIIEQETGSLANRVYMRGREFDVPSCILSADRARRELEWEPQFSLNQGIGQVVRLLKREIQ